MSRNSRQWYLCGRNHGQKITFFENTKRIYYKNSVGPLIINVRGTVTSKNVSMKCNS